MFERHKELFEALMGFMAARGRLPDDTELSEAQQIRANLGSLKKAFRLVCRMTGAEQWERIRQERSQDLLVYLALARFARRQPFSRLPPDLQRDVRAFFATYKHACSQADQLLFSPGDRQAVEEAFSNTPVGKLMPTALYLHESALVSLPPTLRIYEGCARALVGTIEGANIIKLHRSEPLVSYLAYPDFAGTAHPALIGSLAVHLQTFQVKYYDYSDSDNAPILHRKDTLVATSHPDYERFRALTVAEEGAGLLSAPDIGHRRSWERLLLERGLAIRDHQLIPLSDASGFERLPPAQGGGLD